MTDAAATRLSSRTDFTPAHARPATRPMTIPEVAAAARRNVLETIPALAYRLPIVSGRTVARWHMVQEPAALKRVLLDNVDNYPKSPTSLRLLSPRAGASIFTSEGDEWRWQRRAAAPIFSRKKMAALAPMMTAAADRAAHRFDKAIVEGFEGVGVACVMDEMVTATFEIVRDALLSGGVSDAALADAAPALDRREIGAAVERYLETIGRVSLLDVVNAPQWVPRPAALLNSGVLDDMVARVDAMIAARRRLFETGDRRDDLIDYMLEARDPETGRAMDDETLRNNLVTFIVAGHETTAQALSWALYLLANAPEIQDRAADEAQAALGAARPAEAGDIERLGYVRRIVDEAMRLYPPAAMLGRQARDADQLVDRAIQPGDLIILPIYALHRHDLYWERPMRFDPENFSAERIAARDRYLYLPFGAGPRVCIGMSFSLMEATIILATLVARFRFQAKSGHRPEPVLTMTLRPKGGMPLRVSRR